MKSTWRTVMGTMLVAAFLPGCQSAPDVRSDYDRSADFGKFRTFNFVAQPATDKLGYSSLTTQQLEVAVAEQMRQRGYTQADHPDLLVNFSGKLQNMQEVRSTPATVGPYYGYRSGSYGAWPGYAGDVYTVNYTQGTLNIDIVDAAANRMVWEGVGVGEVTQEHLQNREAMINKAVTDIFARYPFRAGQSQPITTASKE